jgi:hypothetical protein
MLLSALVLTGTNAISGLTKELEACVLIKFLPIQTYQPGLGDRGRPPPHSHLGYHLPRRPHVQFFTMNVT